MTHKKDLVRFAPEAELKLASMSEHDHETWMAKLRQRNDTVDTIVKAKVMKSRSEGIGITMSTMGFFVTYVEETGFHVHFDVDLDVAEFSGDQQTSEIEAIFLKLLKDVKEALALLEKGTH